MKIKMIALNTFRGVEGFICRGTEFLTSERRAEILKRGKLAERIMPEENKMMEPKEFKSEDEGEKEKKEVDNVSVLLDEDKYKVSDLEDLAKLLEMSGYSGLNKGQLLKRVSEELVARGISDFGGMDKEKVVEVLRDKR